MVLVNYSDDEKEGGTLVHQKKLCWGSWVPDAQKSCGIRAIVRRRGAEWVNILAGSNSCKRQVQASWLWNDDSSPTPTNEICQTHELYSDYTHHPPYRLPHFPSSCVAWLLDLPVVLFPDPQQWLFLDEWTEQVDRVVIVPLAWELGYPTSHPYTPIKFSGWS